MSDTPDVCQYHGCEARPDGALDFYVGVRWFCTEHYTRMIQLWNQTDGPEVYEEPTDENDPPDCEGCGEPTEYVDGYDEAGEPSGYFCTNEECAYD